MCQPHQHGLILTARKAVRLIPSTGSGQALPCCTRVRWHGRRRRLWSASLPKRSPACHPSLTALAASFRLLRVFKVHAGSVRLPLSKRPQTLLKSPRLKSSMAIRKWNRYLQKLAVSPHRIVTLHPRGKLTRLPPRVNFQYPLTGSLRCNTCASPSASASRTKTFSIPSPDRYAATLFALHHFCVKGLDN